MAAASNLPLDPVIVMHRDVLAGISRRLPPLFCLAASCRRSIGSFGAGFGGLIWQRNGFEIHLRWHCLPPGWRLLLGEFAVFGITHRRIPFLTRSQPTASGKVPRNGESG